MISRNSISQLLIQLFNESKGRYGAPRLQAALRKLGEYVGIKRVKRLIQKNPLQAKAKRKYKATTDSQHNLLVALIYCNNNFVVINPIRFGPAISPSFLPKKVGFI